jgi:hypothetical protein
VTDDQKTYRFLSHDSTARCAFEKFNSLHGGSIVQAGHQPILSMTQPYFPKARHFPKNLRNDTASARPQKDAAAGSLLPPLTHPIPCCKLLKIHNGLFFKQLGVLGSSKNWVRHM